MGQTEKWIITMVYGQMRPVIVFMTIEELNPTVINSGSK